MFSLTQAWEGRRGGGGECTVTCVAFVLYFFAVGVVGLFLSRDSSQQRGGELIPFFRRRCCVLCAVETETGGRVRHADGGAHQPVAGPAVLQHQQEPEHQLGVPQDPSGTNHGDDEMVLPLLWAASSATR